MSKEIDIYQRKLHIGGKIAHAGWENLNAVPGEHVDYARNAKDLSIFPDNIFSDIYASHVLEHFDYIIALDVVREWKRVLKPQGKIYISVPDLDNLCRLFLMPDLSLSDRCHVMRFMFGGHLDKYDYHLQGFNFKLLNNLLKTAGFILVRKVSKFDTDFNDTSTMQFAGVAVSLNIIAEKPLPVN